MISDTVVSSPIDLLTFLVAKEILLLSNQKDFENLCQKINYAVNSDLFSLTVWNEDTTLLNPVFVSHQLLAPEPYIAQAERLSNIQIKDKLYRYQSSFVTNDKTYHYLGFHSSNTANKISLCFLTKKPFEQQEIQLLSAIIQLLFDKIHFSPKQSNKNAAEKTFSTGLQNEFISIITHDMRNPLGCIKGYVTTLMREDVKWPKETQQQFLQIINNEADRLSEMITNFLETSRIQSGDYELNYEPLSIHELLFEIREQNVIKHPNFTITIQAPEKEIIVFLDKKKISHAIQNLIENAVKHANISEIWIKIINIEKGVTIEIEDHGEGIPEERLNNIFNKFSRIPKIAPGTHGSGLGLYICREIIMRHGGTINADSSPGNGTKFLITLPSSPIDLTQ